jgi:sugar phosphate isomerase/epimerase
MNNRLAANTGSYAGHALSDALAGIAAAGYRYVELAAIPGVVEHVPLGADTQDLETVQVGLQRHRLVAVSLAAHSDLTTEAGRAAARRALALCERLDIGLLNTAVGGPFNEEEDEAAFLAGIPALADYAADRSVVIGLEIHGTLTGTGAKTRALVEKVNHPAVRINYDTGNSEFFAGVPVAEDLPAALPYVAHCHLKDKIGGPRVWNFPALGQGHIDFKHLLGLFEQVGYAGPFSVEVEFEGGPPPALEKVNEAMLQSREYLAGLGLGG